MPTRRFSDPCQISALLLAQLRTSLYWSILVYLSFFFGRSWLLWPHFRLRQLLARGGRRACGRKEDRVSKGLG